MYLFENNFHIGDLNEFGMSITFHVISNILLYLIGLTVQIGLPVQIGPKVATDPNIDILGGIIIIGAPIIIYLLLSLKNSYGLEVKKGKYTINIVAYIYKETAWRLHDSQTDELKRICPKVIIICEEDRSGTVIRLLFGKENWVFFDYIIYFLENRWRYWADFLISKYSDGNYLKYRGCTSTNTPDYVEMYNNIWGVWVYINYSTSNLYIQDTEIKLLAGGKEPIFRYTLYGYKMFIPIQTLGDVKLDIEALGRRELPNDVTQGDVAIRFG